MLFSFAMSNFADSGSQNCIQLAVISVGLCTIRESRPLDSLGSMHSDHHLQQI